MRNLKFGIILLTAFAVFSCADDELKYSCDPELDKFVIENQSELKSAGITELSTYDDDLQRAAYRSFTPEKKHEVWSEKFTVLASDEQYSEAEQVHITSLQQQLSIELFNPENNEAFIGFMEFYTTWENTAQNVLNWDNSMLAFVTSSLSLYYSDFMFGTTTMSPTVPIGGEECDCKRSSDACPSGFYCKEVVCNNDSSDGCGILWLEECDGACSSY